MTSLLNIARPPVFCPGCSHERITHTLDQAFQTMGLSGNQIVMVSDIGCSGLFDTFFHTHAMHGLHGRALYYELAWPGRHHDYLICSACGAIGDINAACPVDALEQELARKTGYQGMHHELVFFGVCPECQVEKK